MINWQNGVTPLNEINLNNIFKSTVITQSGTDLNNLKQPDIYYIPANVSVTNIPAGVNGWLWVMYSGSEGAVKQVWFRHGTSNTNDYETYIRTYDGGTWSAWKKIIVNGDVTSGDLTVNETFFSSIDMKKYAKHGNVIECNFRGVMSRDIPNNTTLITLPQNAKISGTVIAYVGAQYGVTTPIWTYHSTGSNYLKCGNALSSGVSGKYLHIQFVYICE